MNFFGILTINLLLLLAPEPSLPQPASHPTHSSTHSCSCCSQPCSCSHTLQPSEHRANHNISYRDESIKVLSSFVTNRCLPPRSNTACRHPRRSKARCPSSSSSDHRRCHCTRSHSTYDCSCCHYGVSAGHPGFGCLSRRYEGFGPIHPVAADKGSGQLCNENKPYFRSSGRASASARFHDFTSFNHTHVSDC